MTAKKLTLFISLSALIVLVFLYLDFAYDAGAYKEDTASADAIIVLAGGLGRIDKGIELLASGRAGYLIIAGADKDASLKSIFFRKDIKLDTGNIIIEKKSTSTYENATETKKIIKSKGIESVILITSYYHMKRASYIFQHILPSKVNLYLYPVSTPNFDETKWWRGRGPVLLAVEFFKFYWYRFWV